MTDTILVVEDEEDDVFFIKDALNRAGVAGPVQAVTDGQQAVDYFKGTGRFANRELFPFPSFVLLDLKLPYLGGFGVLKWIRQEAQLCLPVVILTSSESDADIEQAWRLGANAYLVKPSETTKRLEIARAIKEFWFTHNRAPVSKQDFVASR